MVIDHGHQIYDGTLDRPPRQPSAPRTLVVDLATSLPPIEIAGATVTKVDGPRQHLTFPTTTKAAPLLAQIAANYPLVDLTIAEPTIESVITQLYTPTHTGQARNRRPSRQTPPRHPWPCSSARHRRAESGNSCSSTVPTPSRDQPLRLGDPDLGIRATRSRSRSRCASPFVVGGTSPCWPHTSIHPHRPTPPPTAPAPLPSPDRTASSRRSRSADPEPAGASAVVRRRLRPSRSEPGRCAVPAFLTVDSRRGPSRRRVLSSSSIPAGCCHPVPTAAIHSRRAAVALLRRLTGHRARSRTSGVVRSLTCIDATLRVHLHLDAFARLRRKSVHALVPDSVDVGLQAYSICHCWFCRRSLGLTAAFDELVRMLHRDAV